VRMERNYFLAVIFVTCYTIPLVVISGCYALIARRVSNRGALGLRDGGGQTVVQRSKVQTSHAYGRCTPELVHLVAAACRRNQPEVIGNVDPLWADMRFRIVSATPSYSCHGRIKEIVTSFALLERRRAVTRLSA